MQRALAVAVLLLAARAHAGGAALALIDGGDTVTVVARGAVAAAGGRVSARGDALELPLAAGATTARIESDDVMVKRMEIVGGATPRLIVRLHHSKKTCGRLANEAVARAGDGELRLVIPRSGSGRAVATPAPAPAPTEVAPVAQPAAEPGRAPDAPVAAAPAPAPTPAPAPAPVVETKAEPAPVLAAAAPIADKRDNFTVDQLVDDHKPSSPLLPWLVVLAIVAVPAALWAKKRNAVAKPAAGALKVLASQSLGGRSKLVLIEAEGQKVLLAVDDRSTRVVANLGAAAAAAAAAVDDRDDEDEAPAGDDLDADLVASLTAGIRPSLAAYNEPAATGAPASRPPPAAAAAAAAPPAPAPAASASPAIAGLLKLRAGADAANAPATSGPTEWGEVLRRAAARVKS